MQEVKDRNLINSLHKYSSLLVEDNIYLSLEWLTLKDWVAIPIEHPIYYPDAEWIAEAAQYMGISECYAINIDDQSKVYKVAMSQEGLLEFNRTCSLQYFLLIPIDVSFAILFEGDFYYIVAGQKEFVRKGIGFSFKTAYLMFKELAENADNPQERKLLKAVLDRYHKFFH